MTAAGYLGDASMPALTQGMPDFPTRWRGAWCLAGEAGGVHAAPTFLAGTNTFDAQTWAANPFVVWIGAPPAGKLAMLSANLSGDERAEITRLRQPQDQLDRMTGRTVARLLLGRVLACPAPDVKLALGAHGKPGLDPHYHWGHADRLFFNISHIRGLVAVALAASPVGIDIEAVRPFPEMAMVVQEQFAPEMAADWSAADREAERIDLFYRFWTLGEAFIKATGEGLSQGLGSFAFSALGTPALRRVDPPWGPVQRWTFGTF